MPLPIPGYSEHDGTPRSRAYLDHCELNPADIETFETLLARYKQDEHSTTRPGDGRLRHGGWDLIIVSRRTDPNGQLASTDGIFALSANQTGPEAGSGPYVCMAFNAAGQALPTVRQEVPHGWSASPDLQAFASSVPGLLPGWTARVHKVRDQTRLREQVWDLGMLDYAFEQYVMHEVAILTGPDHTRLVAVPRPGVPDQFLVGALHPTSVPREILDTNTYSQTDLPWAIAVSREPARAATEIRQRLLARYHQALWQVRVSALTAAADGIDDALAVWDAVSDSLCDEQGWPLDDVAYSAGKTTRDARAWKHVETFLALGPDLLADVRDLLVDDDRVSGPLSEDLGRMSGIDTTLSRAAAVREEWEQVTALMAGITPGGLTEADIVETAIARNEDGWAYAHELTRNGRALASAAERLTGRVSTPRTPERQRTRAALSRSGKAPTAPVADATTPTSSPARAARRSR